MLSHPPPQAVPSTGQPPSARPSPSHSRPQDTPPPVTKRLRLAMEPRADLTQPLRIDTRDLTPRKVMEAVEIGTGEDLARPVWFQVTFWGP